MKDIDLNEVNGLWNKTKAALTYMFSKKGTITSYIFLSMATFLYVPVAYAFVAQAIYTALWASALNLEKRKRNEVYEKLAKSEAMLEAAVTQLSLHHQLMSLLKSNSINKEDIIEIFENKTEIMDRNEIQLIRDKLGIMISKK